MILSDKEKQRLIESLSWMVLEMQHKYNVLKENLPHHGDGGYSDELTEVMNLLEDIKKTETTETTGCHRKQMGVNCRDFDCGSNRQGTCALSRITLEKIGSLLVGKLNCVQAEEKKKEEEEK